MACTNSIVAMAVMGTSPRLANQHGGASLATIANLAPFYGMSTNPLRPEPCPYDSFGNLVTSFVAGTVDSANNAFAPSEVAFDVGECTKVPWQPSQPKIFGLFVGVMALAALLNTCAPLAVVLEPLDADACVPSVPSPLSQTPDPARFSIGALNKIVIFSIFMHSARLRGGWPEAPR